MSAGNKSQTHGITLMEVLISIFVVSIGLLGVAALIPLAGHQTEQGSRNDRKANVGRRSFREFMVRGFNNPGTVDEYRWIANSGSRNDDQGDGIVFIDSAGGLGQQATGTQPAVFQDSLGYCIDPLFLAANGLPNFPGRAVFFPFVPLPDWRYSNVPSASQGQPLRDLDNNPWPLPRVTLAFNKSAISRPVAEELFYFRDDLNFALPEENDQNAKQIMLRANIDGNGLQDVKRDAAENYSWFATLTPAEGQWILSTIIVRDRDLSLGVGDYAGLPLGEISGHIADVSNPGSNSSGYYSLDGDVRIDWGPISWPNVQRLEKGVPTGAWVFVAIDGGPINSFAWYRVSSARDIEVVSDSNTSTEHAFQDVTLVGPPLIEGDMIVGYVVGAEAVYQKSIKVGP